MTEVHDKDVHAAAPRGMFYLGVCLTCEEEKIRRMLAARRAETSWEQEATRRSLQL
jgi:hypothetical protein